MYRGDKGFFFISTVMKQYALPKRHKLCSVTAIDTLFANQGDVEAAIAYPLRALWRNVTVNPAPNTRDSDSMTDPRNIPSDGIDDTVSATATVEDAHRPTHKFMISVPKKRLRHAVDRVRMRRLIREAYRLNHRQAEDTTPALADKHIAFIYVADSLKDYSIVERAMRRLLDRIHCPAKQSNGQ